MATDQSILEVKDLSVSFDDNTILDNISFSLDRGEVLAVVGPNGAGKSTLIRAILNLLPFSGRVTWKKDIKIGYVPQKLSIERDLPLTVREFLVLKDPNLKAVHKSLADVGLHEHILDNSIGVVSGGEMQRIMIAWALLGNPDVLLFDEPTAGIDIGGEETIYQLLHKIQDSHSLTLLLISHDLNIVYQYANNVLCLNKKMICFGEPNTVLDPKGLAELYGSQPKFFHHDHGQH